MEINQDSLDKAREILYQGLSRFPQDGSLYKNLGQLEQKSGNLELAAHIFRQGLQHDSRFVELHRSLAYVLMDLNDPDLFDEAEKHFQIAFDKGIIKHDDPRYLKLQVSLLHTHPLGKLTWHSYCKQGLKQEKLLLTFPV